VVMCLSPRIAHSAGITFDLGAHRVATSSFGRIQTLLSKGIDFSVGVIVAWGAHRGSGAGFLAKNGPK
jgi:hypothetical protein